MKEGTMHLYERNEINRLIAPSSKNTQYCMELTNVPLTSDPSNSPQSTLTFHCQKVYSFQCALETGILKIFLPNCQRSTALHDRAKKTRPRIIWLLHCLQTPNTPVTSPKKTASIRPKTLTTLPCPAVLRYKVPRLERRTSNSLVSALPTRPCRPSLLHRSSCRILPLVSLYSQQNRTSRHQRERQMVVRNIVNTVSCKSS